MTTDAQAEEVPFLSGMERKPEESPTVLRFEMDGLKETVRQVKIDSADAIKAALLGLRAAMVNHGDRGRDPDYDDTRDLVFEAAKAGAAAAGAQFGGYHEAPREPREDKGASWKERVLTICGTLVVIGIPALVIMYGQLSALKSTQDAQQVLLANQQAQINQLTQLMLNRRP